LSKKIRLTLLRLFYGTGSFRQRKKSVENLACGKGALEFFSYDNLIVKYFAGATIVWGVIGMTVGLTVALQLVFPALNFDLPYTTFGRIRLVAHQRRDFCLCGRRHFCGCLLIAPTPA
jgi:cbb3-type cytochrome oxidase subunit 1